MSHCRRLLLLLLLAALPACRAGAPPLSPTEVYQRTSVSTVIVSTPAGSGSGTVILERPSGTLVLTAFHVVEGARRVAVVVPAFEDDTPGRLEVAARVLDVDPKADLALLETRLPLPLPALPVARDEPDLYEEMYIVASPLGLFGTAAPAVLSSKTQRLQAAERWQFTGFILFGSSGGTLVNRRAELVGIPVVVATWQNLPVPQLGFAVPLGSIRAFLDRAVARWGIGP